MKRCIHQFKFGMNIVPLKATQNSYFNFLWSVVTT
jgi:hypothetical protein